MAVMIRMRRMGSNKKPYFRIVVADSRRKINGRYLEMVGWYDPKQKGTNFELKAERVEFWTQQGAQMSIAVKNLMRKHGQLPKKAAAPAVAEAAPVAG